MLAGIEMTVSELVSEVSRDRPFYQDSGGGVTFSGGEPMVQRGFLRDVLSACRREGIHSCVDTCGFCEWEDLLEIAGFADCFLYDLKAMDHDLHRRVTGQPNAPILDNLRRLCAVHGDITVRLALIPGITDSGDNVMAVKEFISSLDGNPRLELLPYHDTWRGKLYRLGRTDG